MFKRLQQDKLFFDSGVLFVVSFLASTLHLIYQLVMVRLLGAVDFSRLSAILSTLVILSIPTTSFQTLATKFISGFQAQEKNKEARFVTKKLFAHSLIFAFVIFVVLCLFSIQIKNFLRLDSYFPVFILSALVFLACITPVLLGGLQGLKKFGWLGTNSLINGVFRLASAALFVRLGWGLNGALFGFLVASLFTFVLVIFPLKEYLFNKVMLNLDFKKIYGYILPVAITYLCFMSLTNIDMVLVQHFFPSANFYAVAQIVGKIVLFLPGAISIVMFPHTSGKHAKQDDHLSVFKKSFTYAAGLCFFAVIVYNLMPGFILKVLTGQAQAESVLLARLFTLVMTFFALDNVMFMYQLSINEFGFLRSLIALALVEIFLIAFMHPSLSSVLWIALSISVALFIINYRKILLKKYA